MHCTRIVYQLLWLRLSPRYLWILPGEGCISSMPKIKHKSILTNKLRNSLRDTQLPKQMGTFVSLSCLITLIYVTLCDTPSLKRSLHSFSNSEVSLYLWLPISFLHLCLPATLHRSRLSRLLPSVLFCTSSSPPKDDIYALVLQMPAPQGQPHPGVLCTGASWRLEFI